MRATTPEAVAVAFGAFGAADADAEAAAVARGALGDVVVLGFGEALFGFGFGLVAAEPEGLAEALGVFDAVGVGSPLSGLFQG